MPTRPLAWRAVAPLLIPALFALLMVRNASPDGAVDASPIASAGVAAATATGTVAGGRNHPTDLRDTLIALAVETLLLYVVLRPWSYRRRSIRSLVAVALALPWTILQAQSIGDAGGVVQLHMLWLVMLDAVLLLLVLLRFARRGGEQ